MYTHHIPIVQALLWQTHISSAVWVIFLGSTSWWIYVICFTIWNHSSSGHIPWFVVKTHPSPPNDHYIVSYPYYIYPSYHHVFWWNPNFWWQANVRLPIPPITSALAAKHLSVAETSLWLVVRNMFDFPRYWEQSSQLTFIIFRGRYTTNQFNTVDYGLSSCSFRLNMVHLKCNRGNGQSTANVGVFLWVPSGNLT